MPRKPKRPDKFDKMAERIVPVLRRDPETVHWNDPSGLRRRVAAALRRVDKAAYRLEKK